MKRILVVEDDAALAQIYRHRLERAGFAVLVVSDGVEADRQAHEWYPDGILLDVMLPRMNGIDLLKKLRRERAFEKIPIFIATNGYVSTVISDALDAQATRVLNKSETNPAQVVEMFAAALGGKQCVEETAAATAKLRGLLLEASKGSEEERCRGLRELLRCLQTTPAFQQAASPFAKEVRTAMETFIAHLVARPELAGVSALRSLAIGVDCLAEFGNAEIGSAAPLRVLAVDDEPLALRAVTSALGGPAFRLRAVESASDVLAAIEAEEFDAFVFDVTMPEMDGFELCQRIRQSGARFSAPVIFLTSAKDLAARARARVVGGTEFMTKPFLYAELRVKVLALGIRHRGGGAAHTAPLVAPAVPLPAGNATSQPLRP